MSKTTLPKNDLVRARPGLEVRETGDEGSMPTLHGYFLRFNEWTEIDSLFEGRFMERIAPGAAKKTLAQRGDKVKILFNHGHDPSIGEKALTDPGLKEDETGVHYEGELFDTSYNRDLVPGLRTGQYGASFKFSVVSEEIDQEPERSDENPDGIPERTITEIKLYEGGPVTFPAYDGATAGVRCRSLTDEFTGDGLDNLVVRWAERNPERAKELLARTDAEETGTNLDEEAEPSSDETTPAPETEQTEDHPHSSNGRSRGSREPIYGSKKPNVQTWRLGEK